MMSTIDYTQRWGDIPVWSHYVRKTCTQTHTHTYTACTQYKIQSAQLDSQLQGQPAGEEKRKRWREMKSAVAQTEAYEG